MPMIHVHAKVLDERCEECGKFMLRTFERVDRDLCQGHIELSA